MEFINTNLFRTIAVMLPLTFGLCVGVFSYIMDKKEEIITPLKSKK